MHIQSTGDNQENVRLSQSPSNSQPEPISSPQLLQEHAQVLFGKKLTFFYLSFIYESWLCTSLIFFQYNISDLDFNMYIRIVLCILSSIFSRSLRFVFNLLIVLKFMLLVDTTETFLDFRPISVFKAHKFHI